MYKMCKDKTAYFIKKVKNLTKCVISNPPEGKVLLARLMTYELRVTSLYMIKIS